MYCQTLQNKKSSKYCFDNSHTVTIYYACPINTATWSLKDSGSKPSYHAGRDMCKYPRTCLGHYYT